MALWQIIRTIVFGILGVLLGVLSAIWRAASGEAEAERIRERRRELALRCLRVRLLPEEAKRINRELMRAAPDWGEMVRCFQIIADSLDIALKSKKPETAHARMEDALRLLEESRRKQGYLLTENDWRIAEEHVVSARQKFETAWRVNSVTALLEKAATLKTEKAKTKYIAEARAILEEGLGRTDADTACLQALLSKVSAA